MAAARRLPPMVEIKKKASASETRKPKVYKFIVVVISGCVTIVLLIFLGIGASTTLRNLTDIGQKLDRLNDVNASAAKGVQRKLSLFNDVVSKATDEFQRELETVKETISAERKGIILDGLNTEGWCRIGKFSLIRIDELVNHSKAIVECERIGGLLASAALRTIGILSHLKDCGLVGNGVNMWIGYTDIKNEGSWTFLDGDESVPAIPWAKTEPNNDNSRGGSENCAEIPYWSPYHLNDRDCSILNAYLCENHHM